MSDSYRASSTYLLETIVLVDDVPMHIPHQLAAIDAEILHQFSPLHSSQKRLETYAEHMLALSRLEEPPLVWDRTLFSDTYALRLRIKPIGYETPDVTYSTRPLEPTQLALRIISPNPRNGLAPLLHRDLMRLMAVFERKQIRTSHEDFDDLELFSLPTRYAASARELYERGIARTLNCTFPTDLIDDHHAIRTKNGLDRLELSLYERLLDIYRLS